MAVSLAALHPEEDSLSQWRKEGRSNDSRRKEKGVIVMDAEGGARKTNEDVKEREMGLLIRLVNSNDGENREYRRQ